MAKRMFLAALLWMNRSFGFELQCEGTFVYEWLRTPTGRIEHWFDSPA